MMCLLTVCIYRYIHTHYMLCGKYTHSHTPIVLYYIRAKSGQEVKSFVPAPGVVPGWRHKFAAVMQEIEKQ